MRQLASFREDGAKGTLRFHFRFLVRILFPFSILEDIEDARILRDKSTIVYSKINEYKRGTRWCESVG